MRAACHCDTAWYMLGTSKLPYQPYTKTMLIAMVRLTGPYQYQPVIGTVCTELYQAYWYMIHESVPMVSYHIGMYHPHWAVQWTLLIAILASNRISPIHSDAYNYLVIFVVIVLSNQTGFSPSVATLIDNGTPTV